MAIKPKLYPHRHTNHGSICLTCFGTVSGSKADVHLHGHGIGHICDSAFLAERGIFTRGESTLRLAGPVPGTQPYPRSEEAA